MKFKMNLIKKLYEVIIQQEVLIKELSSKKIRKLDLLIIRLHIKRNRINFWMIKMQIKQIRRL